MPPLIVSTPLAGRAERVELAAAELFAESLGDDHRRARHAGVAAGLIARLARAFLFPEDDGELVTADAGDQIMLARSSAS